MYFYLISSCKLQREIYKRDGQTIEKLIKEYQYSQDTIYINVNGPTSNSNTETDSTDVAPDREYYLVTAAYLNLEDVKEFQKIIKRELGISTLVKISENGKFYFAYTEKYISREGAEKEISELYKKGASEYISGKLWIYTEK